MFTLIGLGRILQVCPVILQLPIELDFVRHLLFLVSVLIGSASVIAPLAIILAASLTALILHYIGLGTSLLSFLFRKPLLKRLGPPPRPLLLSSRPIL